MELGLLPGAWGAPNKGNAKSIFGFAWTRVGFGPATGPTLKTALCHIRTLVGRMINIFLERPTMP